jgi:ribosomal protein S18 acetylase RimI-like enzyme
MLRGWSEGFDIPSLGLFVHPQFRALGLGRAFMEFLHSEAKRKGADQIRLTVHSDNVGAVALYRSFKYDFQPLPGSNGRLVGFVRL